MSPSFKEDTGDQEQLSVIGLEDEGFVKNAAGWFRFERTGQMIVEDENLPFCRGMMIQIVKSPSPDKVPDGSMAMFLDYNKATYKVHDLIVKGVVHEQQVQYNMKVLYNEKVVELFNARLEEMGSNYIKASRKPFAGAE